MQIIGSDKFKFFPVKFRDVIIPLGQIRAIYASSHNVMIDVEHEDTFEISDMSIEQAMEIIKKAYDECE